MSMNLAARRTGNQPRARRILVGQYEMRYEIQASTILLPTYARFIGATYHFCNAL